LRRNRTALLALGILCAFALLAVLAPAVAPYEPNAQPDIVGLARAAPSLAHPFGTDNFSRDVLSRVIYGSRVSLGVALLAVLLSITLGTAYGAVAGYVGGPLDNLMMRVIDALLAVPRVLLLILALALWGQIALPALILVLGLTGWFATSRLVRARVRALAVQDFALAARALGARNRRILWRHVLPNALSPVLVAATLGIGNVIVLEAGLSYFGLGVQPPHASWGNIIQDGSDQIARGWWIALCPGLAMLVTVVCFNIVGDALRDALDPREDRRG
jgi:peptide/nickel transport system permease protein